MLFNYEKKQDVLNLINNVAITPDGFNFICYLLDELQAFDTGNNFENQYINCSNNAIRQKGQKILNLLMQSNLEKYIEVIKKRKEDL